MNSTILILFILISTNLLINAAPKDKRPPGTLLLNMLTKNEAEHLDRTLPRWAKIIDAWVIGIDDKNDDNSPEIIKKHLGHIPGEVVVVHFDGMGPTWSRLVDVGLANYPNITHGIIADADYMPMQSKMNKMELDIRCSKHMYTIFTEDHQNERRMDWIYRNVPGAHVKRRTHQSVEVPAFPNQEVFQTLINLKIEERSGGYQDRTGKKAENYIKFLEADLVDYPGDTRTLYYLGHAHYDMFKTSEYNPTAFHYKHLKKSVEYFQIRADTKGNQEEGWFAVLKLAEIYEKYYKKWAKAAEYYERCIKEDAVRAEPWFYFGSHYRNIGKEKKALPYLFKCSKMAIPDRALFTWHNLYNCFSKIELAKSAVSIAEEELGFQEYKEILSVLNRADCRGAEPHLTSEINEHKKTIKARMASVKDNGFVGKTIKFNIDKRPDPLAEPEELLDDIEVPGLTTELEEDAQNEPASEEVKSDAPKSAPVIKTVTGTDDAAKILALKNVVEIITENLDNLRQLGDDRLKSFSEFSSKLLEFTKKESFTCREYRRATTSYLKFMLDNAKLVHEAMDDEVQYDSWKALNEQVTTFCR